MRKKKPTLYDVAKEAGVSIATVSNVLNKKKKESSEKTKKKVLEAVAQLGYSPNEYARGLKKGRSNLIGLIIPDQNPFFTETLKGINEQCDALGLRVMVASSEENEDRQNELVDIFIAQQVTGILLVPVKSTLPNNENWRDYPIVLIDRQIEGAFHPSVSAANVEGSWKATERLIKNGHKRIGIILASRDISTTVERRLGYEQALNSNGLVVDPDLILFGGECSGTQAQINGGYQSVLKMLELPHPPTAVIAINHLLMLGALKAFKEKDVQMPKKIAFIGFDDHPWNEINTPSITVVSQPAYEMGKQAIIILNQVLEGHMGHSIKLPMDLIIRESCGTTISKK